MGDRFGLQGVVLVVVAAASSLARVHHDAVAADIRTTLRGGYGVNSQRCVPRHRAAGPATHAPHSTVTLATSHNAAPAGHGAQDSTS